MKTGEVRLLLSVAIGNTRITAGEETVLGKTGAAELDMARAYLSDGTTFDGSGDPVNALASFLYAFGWLHFGCRYGTLENGMRSPPCPFSRPLARLPPAAAPKLTEKTVRYQRLLATARSSVSCAADPSVRQHGFAEQVLRVAEAYNIRGDWLLQELRYEDALASFSYGHGWLDAGVMAGLYVITDEREIFTV